MCFLWIDIDNKPWSEYTNKPRRQQEEPGLFKVNSDTDKQLILGI